MAIIPVPDACVNCGSGGGGGSTYDFELDVVCVVIDGESQTAFRREVYNNGVTTVVFLGVDGTVLVPDTWSPGGCPCGGLVFQEVLCDDGVDPIHPFLRIYDYGANGLLESTTDYELDGVTPYVVTGDVVVCSGSSSGPTSDVCVVCPVTIGTIDDDITVNQGTSPWVISGTVSVDNFPASVEISNDVGNPIPVSGTVCIDDCGGSITVDGTVELGATTLAALETVTVLQGTSPWVVSGSFSATVASDHTEDSPHTSGDIGSFALGVRNDTHGTLTTTDLDYSPLSVDSSGALNVADNGGSLTVDGTVAATQSGAWTVAVSNFPASVEVSNDVGNPLPVSGTVTANQGTSPWVVSGTVTVTDGSGPLTVDGTVTANQGTSPWVVSGTVTTDTEFPAASVLADADPNPTTTRVGANGLVFNGTTWDRVREPTSDAMAVTGLQAAPEMVWNGTSWDRAKTVTSSDGATTTGLQAVGPLVFDGSGWNRFRSPTGDGNAVTGYPGDANLVFNGTTWDRMRSGTATGSVLVDSELPAAAALTDATANPTVPTVGSDNLVFNGTTWDRQRSATADALASTGLTATGTMVFNGTTWDRLKEPTADTVAATGIASTGSMIWNGSTFDRWKGALGDNVSLNGIGFVMGGALTAGGGFDKLRESHSDAQAVTGIQAAGNMIYNGATWDRMREATADGVAATGLQADGNMVFNGTTWDRMRSGTPTGSGLVSVGGSSTPTTSLNAQSTVQNGTVLDSGSARTHNTIVVITSAGVSAGTVQIQVSQDNTNWFVGASISTTAASTIYSTDVVGAFRYARAAISVAITGGTITATLASV